MKKAETVLLIHGFYKDGSDMANLKHNLISLGYNVALCDLPAKFHSLERCSSILAQNVYELLAKRGEEKIHLVGHSMGGLVIRHLLGNNWFPSIGRCVFIATPNKGTRLVDILQYTCWPIFRVLKPMGSLTTKNASKLPPLTNISKEIGIIAGNKSDLILSHFLPGENDGRVEVESCKINGMKDFIILNYGHKDIHYQMEVAELIDSFLQHGYFKDQGTIKPKGVKDIYE